MSHLVKCTLDTSRHGSTDIISIPQLFLNFSSSTSPTYLFLTCFNAIDKQLCPGFKSVSFMNFYITSFMPVPPKFSMRFLNTLHISGGRSKPKAISSPLLRYGMHMSNNLPHLSKFTVPQTNNHITNRKKGMQHTETFPFRFCKERRTYSSWILPLLIAP
ncbi:hypothetical protein QQP08_003971 [Theobroma cacao]|nr:hypothetical protein QQP08_003971 [Theobroma cacao]